MRLALIGAGRIGKVHADSICAHPQIELAAVVDACAQNAEVLARKYSSVVRRVDDVFADAEIDAVLIASSTSTHIDYLERAAAAGKAVLCEKPIALDLAASERSAQTIADSGVHCALAFNRRHDPQYGALKQALASGRIGNLEVLSFTSRDPAPPPADYLAGSGGIFRDMMIHDFDMARWLLDEPIATLHATGSCLVDPAIAEVGDVDTAVVVMTTVSGRLCTISVSRRACFGYDQRIEAFGSGGMLQAENETDTRLKIIGTQGQLEEPPKWFFLERYAEAYRGELDDFYRSWKEGRVPRATIDDGVEALRLADAAQRSLEEECVIRFA
ncbi:inositol 2-dehydrogenase [Halomonas binhaiensis]|uniref:Inositol 2-dehydrogenase n=1 Tax=Halomonas binhaiensis TaxID=2562282 RepID=A0A5C1NNT3_9GAMM|nr:inositol 2-dehydrogenase [Halomonas binhaiensis]QEM83489.1 inositol 2-dehydrogenase [Halomonas binhaiensis]